MSTCCGNSNSNESASGSDGACVQVSRPTPATPTTQGFPFESPAPCCEPQAHIQVCNLSLSYGSKKKSKTVLRDVSLTVNTGCVTAIVGPSGCGKSSFLSAINRLSDLQADCHVTGSIHINGQEILQTDCDVIALRRRVGMIFQKPNPFPFSIRKNMIFPLSEHGVKKPSEIDARVQSALSDVGLWDEVKDRLDDSALTLSGGQQQRLCLARTLALKPDILLLDEPCSALDPIASKVVEDMILKLRGHYTVLVVTHNLAQARRIADHVAVFWAQNGPGQLIESGSAHQIFEAPEHELTQAYVSGLSG